MKKTFGYVLASQIMGDDFITPEEIADKLSLEYTNEQLAAFIASVPDMETLIWLRDNNYMLVAGPPNDMNLLQIRELMIEHFYERMGGWFAEENQDFARTNKVIPNWVALRKGAVPQSFKKTWARQICLLSKNERVPNIAEFVWPIMVHTTVRLMRIIINYSLITSSVSFDGNRVEVGYYNDRGMTISDGCHNIAGLSSKLFLPLFKA